ncbi:MAG: AraC family transcriptional regulator [Armatimonas sp.]
MLCLTPDAFSMLYDHKTIGPTLSAGIFLGESQPLIRTEGLELTWSVYRNQFEMPWHTHDITTLYVHVRGQHTDICESGEFDQPALSVSLHPREVAHRSHIPQQCMAGLNVSLSRAWLECCGLSEAQIGHFAVQIHPLLCRSALSLLIRATASTAESKSDTSAEIESQTLEILSFFGQESPTERSTPRWLRRAEEHLRATYRGPIRLAHIAKEAGVHPVHLARTFRHWHHCTVLEFVHLLRLREVTGLLLYGMPAALAAREVGFADQAHMIRSFRRQAGVPPGALKSLAVLSKS